jgi:hypothetical protein
MIFLNDNSGKKENLKAYFLASHTKIKWVCENKRGHARTFFEIKLEKNDKLMCSQMINSFHMHKLNNTLD